MAQSYLTEHKGYKWYHVEEGLRLSKTKLGLFMYHALKFKAQFGDWYCPQPQYDRAFVGAAICLHPDNKEELERLTGVKLRNPPKIVLN